MAANPSTEAEVLLVLAGDRDWRTRAAVAARQDAPAAAHLMLINDRAWQVIYTLGDNPAVDLEVWRAVATEGSKDLRAYLAGQPFLPLEIARLMLDAPETEVRRTLASQSPHREVLDVLFADPSPVVRCDALRNSLVSHADTDRAVHDRDPVVRGVAVSHLPIRAADLDELIQDRSEFVRSEARARRSSSTTGPDGRLQDPFEELGEEDALVESLAESIAETLRLESGLPRTPSEVAHWPVTPRKPTMKWFKLFSQFHPATDEIPEHVVRLWKIAHMVDRDPDWIAWWEPAPYRVLDLSLGVFGPPGNWPDAEGGTLYASIAGDMTDEAEAAVEAMTEDAANRFFCEWTYRHLEVTLRSVASHCGLSLPPALPELH